MTPLTSPYRTEVALRWSDMDAYGHVNNVQFLRLLEDARIHALRDWFGSAGSPLERGVVVSRHEIEYHAPLVYRPDPVVVDMWVVLARASGIEVGYAVCEGEDSEVVYALAQTGLIWYDFEAARPRRMSPEERDTALRFKGEPVRFRWARK